MSALDNSPQSLLDLYEHAPCGFHSLDSNGIFVRINDTELRWLGYRREEMVGRMKLPDVLTPQGRAIFEEAFPRLKTDGVLRDLELEFVRKDGTRLPVLVSATVVRDERGEFVASRSIVYDLTQRKRTDSQFRAILQAAPDAILICNRQGTLTLANSQAEKVFGYRLDELVGISIETLIPSRFRANHSVHREGFFSNPQTRPMGTGLKLCGLRKDGTEVPVEVSLSPVQTDDGWMALAVVRDVTERRLSEDDLRRSEDKYRSMISAMAEGVVVQERNGTISACNESAERILGLTESQIMGRTSVDPRWKAIHEDGSPFPGETHPSMIALHTGQRQSNVCMGVRRPDGNLNWILINAEPIFYPGTNLARAVVTTFSDITERKKIEEELRKSEERFQIALKNSPTVVFNQDLELRYTWINGPVLGWAEGGWLGKTDGELIEAESAARLTAIKRRVLETGKGTRQEVLVRHGGATAYYDLTVEPLRDINGNIDGITCAATDITRVREAERAIQRQEAQISAFFESSPVGMALLSRDLRYLRVNQQLARINRVPAGEHVGKTISEVLPTLASTVEPMFRKIFTEQASFLNIALDGDLSGNSDETRHWLASYFPVRNPTGPPEVAGGFVLDVTEHKRLEEQLLQAQKLEAIGRLAGGIAHDFNNILGVILGHCELMERECSDDAGVVQRTESIKTSAQHAAALTRQLLAFGRKQVMQMQPLDLNEVIRHLSEMLNRVIGENIELVLDLSPSLGRVNADLVQIEQVVMNLIVNARDAMPKGGRLTVATANVDLGAEYLPSRPSVEPGPYVMVSVADTGQGMDERTMSRLFEPFFTTKEMGRGNGLGLSIIYGIVQQSKGQILVNSELGRGSTFKVYLPRLENLPIEALQKKRAISGAIGGGSETILLVEDDEALRDMVSSMLSRAGYKVICAASAREALVVAKAHVGSIALLLTDMILRGSADGQEVYSLVKSQRPDIRVLFMSGYSETFIAASSESSSAIELLEKPFSWEQLRTRVREILNRHS